MNGATPGNSRSMIPSPVEARSGIAKMAAVAAYVMARKTAIGCR